MMNQIISAQRTDKGRRRPHNEDYIAFFEPSDPQELQSSGNIYIVADGVGGAEKGERASRFAVQKVLYEYYRDSNSNQKDRLRKAFRQAGNEIYQYATDSAELTRMATTMVAAVIQDQTLTVANVGDSRAYLIRNGRIDQITRDHSIVGEMVRNGLMTEEEASRSKVKNKITRSLGGEVDVSVDIFKEIPLYQGDLILLCSDGLTRYASSNDLLEMALQDSLEIAVERMIEFANAAGGVDNISVILIEIGQPLVADQPTLPLPRGLAPEPVDWDTMQTQPSIKVNRKSSGPLIPKEYLLIGFGLFALVFIFGMLLIIFQLSAVLGQSNATPTLYTSPTLTIVVISPYTETVSGASNENTQSVEEGFVPGETIETSDTISESQTISETLVNTETISLEPGNCVYEVKEDDSVEGLSGILSEFDIPYDENHRYFYYESCDIDPPICLLKAELANPNEIQVGHWIIIENVSQDKCVAIEDGYWIP